MYQALYRKYRPTIFEEVIGQKVVVKTLKNAIINNKINHAYLFCGPRGTGKTSLAKIFAKTINCQHLVDAVPCNNCDSCIQINNNQSIDIIEIDAASNNGVDEIRELKNSVNLVPSVGKYKIYIVDEVHMLTSSAFNALLKTLEEPPKHIVFILATTEVHKIPQTVLSRCQRFDFKKITNEEIKKHLSEICLKENIKIDQLALEKIAQFSDGCMRDALSLLDQINAYCMNNITSEDVDEVSGDITSKQMFDLINKIALEKYLDILTDLKQFDDDGKNLTVILNSMIEYLKNLLIYINDSNYFEDHIKQQEYELILKNIEEKRIYFIIELLLETLKSMKYETNKLLLAELCFIKMNSMCKNNKSETKSNSLNISQKKELEKEYKNPEMSCSMTNKIQELQKIRINNTLCLFNKKDTVLFKNNLTKIQYLTTNQKYSSLVSLILDGELKAKGNEYLLFVYKTNNLEGMFNSKLLEIEELFNEVFGQQFKIISVNLKDWNNIKTSFNQALKENKKIYNFIEEPNVSFYMTDSSDTTSNNNSLKTPIDNMFEEIVQYN